MKKIIISALMASVMAAPVVYGAATQETEIFATENDVCKQFDALLKEYRPNVVGLYKWASEMLQKYDINDKAAYGLMTDLFPAVVNDLVAHFHMASVGELNSDVLAVKPKLTTKELESPIKKALKLAEERKMTAVVNKLALFLAQIESERKEEKKNQEIGENIGRMLAESIAPIQPPSLQSDWTALIVKSISDSLVLN